MCLLYLGTGSIFFNDVKCIGTEAKLIDCPRATTHNCRHSEDAGVICQAPIRLSGSNHYYEGRVETYKNGSWGTVCDNSWDIADADVACRMLGFDGAYQAFSGAHFGEGVGTIHYDGLQCNGNEERLRHCAKSPIGGCTHAKDAGVRCRIVRLVDGSNRNEGRVEILDGTWGTVCNPEIGSRDALQIADELSRSAFSRNWTNADTSPFGAGSNDIKISYLRCEGTLP